MLPTVIPNLLACERVRDLTKRIFRQRRIKAHYHTAPSTDLALLACERVRDLTKRIFRQRRIKAHPMLC